MSEISLDKDAVSRLRDMARKQVQAELLKLEETRLLKQFIAEERNKLDPNEEIKEIEVRLPVFMDSIVVDRVTTFWHGVKYNLPMRKFLALRETMQWAWRQSDSVSGESRDNEYRRKTEMVLRR